MPNVLKNIIKYFFGGTSSIVITLSLGVLSFVGALFLWPSFIFAGIAFLLSGAIDALVYKKTILGGFEKLLNPQVIRDEYIAKEIDFLIEQKKITLEKLQDQDANNADVYMLSDYLKLKNALEIADSVPKKIKGETRADFLQRTIQLRAYAKDRKIIADNLRIAKDRLVKNIWEKGNTILDINKEDIENPADRNSKVKKGLNSKIKLMRYLRLGLSPLCIFGGMAFGLVILSSLQAALTSSVLLSALGTVGIASLAVPPVALFVIAGLAAIGYGFMMYHIVAKMICNFKPWVNSLKKIFDKKENEKPVLYVLRCIATVTVAAIITLMGVAVVLATAGVWRDAILDSVIKIIPAISRYALAIANGFAITTLISNFSTTVTNALKTLQGISLSKIGQFFSTPFKKIMNDEHESLLQKWNPLRLIVRGLEIFLKIGLLLGHGAAVGATSSGPEDKIAGIDFSEPADVAETITESLEDGGYLRGSSVLAFIVDYLILGIPKTISAFLDVIANRIARFFNRELPENEKPKRLIVGAAFRKEFGIAEEGPAQASTKEILSSLSKPFKVHVVAEKIAERHKELSSSLRNKDLAVVKQETINQIKVNENGKVTFPKNIDEVVGRHRDGRKAKSLKEDVVSLSVGNENVPEANIATNPATFFGNQTRTMKMRIGLENFNAPVPITNVASGSKKIK